MKSILVIDDDPSILAPVQIHYEKQEVTLYTAKDGRTGLEIAIKQKPAVIVCDVTLPDIDGFSVFQELHDAIDLSTTPFILMSGTSDRDYVRRGMEMGVDDYLTKPFSLEELDSTIQARLRRHQNVKSKFDTTVSLLRQNITYALPHELRTPLMGVLGYAQMLEMDIDSFSKEEITDYASEIRKSGNRLQRVIENYLVFSQLELISTDFKQVQGLRNNLVRARQIIENAATEIAAKYDRQADLDIRVESGALRISKENLKKVIVELVDNAFKFSEAGTPVKVRFLRDGKCFILQIRDYGRGMAQSELNQIGAFMQFNRALHEQQGLGLGLVITRKLAELHECNFEIASRVDEGTLVRIEFSLE